MHDLIDIIRAAVVAIIEQKAVGVQVCCTIAVVLDTESGKPWPEQPGIRFIERQDGYAVYKVPSGSYHFASKI